MKKTSLIIALLLLATFVFAASAKPRFLEPTVAISGKILDASDGNPVGATLSLLDENGKKIGEFKSSSLDGAFFVAGLKMNKKYSLKIEAKNYVAKTKKIKTPNIDEYIEVYEIFELEKDEFSASNK